MKLIKVKDCRECQHCIEVGYPNYYFSCAEQFRIRGIVFKIPNIEIIPKWCPLEDYHEN